MLGSRMGIGLLGLGSLGLATLGASAGMALVAAPTPLFGLVNCICTAGWQASAIEGPPLQACVDFTGETWTIDSSGWCNTKDGCGSIALTCQFILDVTVTNLTANNCGCTGNLWACPDPNQGRPADQPVDISGQNTAAVLTVYYDIPCGTNGAGAGEFGVSVICGDANGPTGGTKAYLLRLPKCLDCPLPPL